MHTCWSLEVHQIPKSHNALIDVFKFFRYVCLNKHEYDIHIKFEVSLHFLSIWPTVRREREEPRKNGPCLHIFPERFIREQLSRALVF